MQSYRVQKTEFLRNIYAPPVAGQFTNLVLPLNPGLQQTFPWLALVAPQFEEYEFIQLMFYWRPMVSDFNSGTGQVGEIVMTTQYNPSEPPFTDLSRAKNYMGAMSSKTSQPMNQGVECDPTKNSGSAGKYIRTGPLTGSNSDLKQYDLGNLNLMISGTPPAYNDQILGELWVAYTVELRKPKLPDSSGSEILRDYFQSALPTLAAANPLYIPSFWAAQPMLMGAQNRLAGNLEVLTIANQPVAGSEMLAFKYTIPSWYTGSLRITATAIGVKTGSGITIYPSGQSGFNTGQVTYNEDLAGGTNGGTGQTIYPAAITAGIDPTFSPRGTGDNANATQIVSITVGENTSGSDNSVVIQLFYYPKGAEPAMAGWSLDVTEYNSAFNSPTTGKLLLVDEEGNNVPQPWS
jgi:hypothetical protein